MWTVEDPDPGCVHADTFFPGQGQIRTMEKFLRHLREIKLNADTIPEEIAPFIVGMVQDNIRDATGPPNSPLTKSLKGDKGPLKDTGQLRNSITYVLEGDTVVVGTNLKHAPMLHFGGVKKPRHAKKLAIPLTKTIRKWTDMKGVKGFLTMLEGQGWKVFFKDEYIGGTPPKGGKKYGLKMKGTDARLLFVRKKSVTIPKRPFMRLTREQTEEIRAIAREHIKDAFEA
jgi:phage gpG-like protein